MVWLAAAEVGCSAAAEVRLSESGASARLRLTGRLSGRLGTRTAGLHARGVTVNVNKPLALTRTPRWAVTLLVLQSGS